MSKANETGKAALLALGMGVAALATQGARADDSADAAGGPAAQERVDEIIVTARYKQEAAQDVPIALSVIGRELLDATGTSNVQQVTAVAPAVQFVSSNPRNTAVNIRGFGSAYGLTNDGLDPGVGIYIDQVYHPRPSASTFDLVDIDRIEILRGPQGTLYGKNTTAGAINLNTRAPDFTAAGKAELSLGNFGFLQGKAAFTGPLSDTVAGKISLVGTRRQGTLTNVPTFSDINQTNNTSVNAQLLWKPHDGLKARFIAEYDEQNAACCTQLYVTVGQIQRTARRYADLAAGLGYAPPSTNPYDRLSDINSGARADQQLGNLTAIVDWDVFGGTLTSVTAWSFWKWRPRNDRDYTRLSILTASVNPSNQNQESQEFRFAADAGKHVDYVVGIYAFRQHLLTRGLQGYGADAAYWLINPVTYAPGTPAHGLMDGYQSTFVADSTVTSNAVFGQLNLKPTDRLTVTPGIRYTSDSKDATYDQQVSGGLANPTLAQRQQQYNVVGPQNYADKFTEGSASGSLNVSYKLSDTVLAYASYTRGYKSGGQNLAGLPAVAAIVGTTVVNTPILSTVRVKPERVYNTEVGIKTQWLDRTITLNLAAFDTSVRDYQTTVVGGTNTVRSYLANVDKVRNRGIEVDGSWSPAHAFTSYVALTFNDGKYVSFPSAPCPLELIDNNSSKPCDLSGQALPGLSKTAGSLGGEYRHASTLFGLSAEAFFGADASYRSQWYSDPSDSQYDLVKGSTVVNFRAGLRAGDNWEAFAWVKNAFNRDYLLFTSNQSGNSGLVLGVPGDPRTFGITFRREF